MDNIGDFAENLISNQLEGIKTGKTLPPKLQEAAKGSPIAKDISNIEVPDDFMKQVLGESYTPKETPTVDSIPELVWTDDEAEKPIPQTLTEETAQQLVPLLEEVRTLLKEMSAGMTTTGQIGVNFAGPQNTIAPEEKKSGYITSKPDKCSRTKKDILKQSIRSKLRKK